MQDAAVLKQYLPNKILSGALIKALLLTWDAKNKKLQQMYVWAEIIKINVSVLWNWQRPGGKISLTPLCSLADAQIVGSSAANTAAESISECRKLLRQCDWAWHCGVVCMSECGVTLALSDGIRATAPWKGEYNDVDTLQKLEACWQQMLWTQLNPI